MDTSMPHSTKLNKYQKSKPVDPKLHRSMLGSLLPLIASRPYIECTTYVCVLDTDLILKNHIFIVAKRIMQFIETFPNLDWSWSCSPSMNVFILSLLGVVLLWHTSMPFPVRWVRPGLWVWPGATQWAGSQKFAILPNLIFHADVLF